MFFCVCHTVIKVLFGHRQSCLGIRALLFSSKSGACSLFGGCHHCLTAFAINILFCCFFFLLFFYVKILTELRLERVSLSKTIKILPPLPTTLGQRSDLTSFEFVPVILTVVQLAAVPHFEPLCYCTKGRIIIRKKRLHRQLNQRLLLENKSSGPETTEMRGMQIQQLT